MTTSASDCSRDNIVRIRHSGSAEDDNEVVVHHQLAYGTGHCFFGMRNTTLTGELTFVLLKAGRQNGLGLVHG